MDAPWIEGIMMDQDRWPRAKAGCGNLIRILPTRLTDLVELDCTDNDPRGVLLDRESGDEVFGRFG